MIACLVLYLFYTSSFKVLYKFWEVFTKSLRIDKIINSCDIQIITFLLFTHRRATLCHCATRTSLPTLRTSWLTSPRNRKARHSFPSPWVSTHSEVSWMNSCISTSHLIRRLVFRICLWFYFVSDKSVRVCFTTTNQHLVLCNTLYHKKQIKESEGREMCFKSRPKFSKADFNSELNID